MRNRSRKRVRNSAPPDCHNFSAQTRTSDRYCNEPANLLGKHLIPSSSKSADDYQRVEHSKHIPFDFDDRRPQKLNMEFVYDEKKRKVSGSDVNVSYDGRHSQLANIALKRQLGNLTRATDSASKSQVLIAGN